MKYPKNKFARDRIKKDLTFMLIFFGLTTFLLILKLKYYGNLIPDWDEAHHLKMGYYFYRAILEQNWNWIHDLLTFTGGIYPPLYHVLIALNSFLFGVSPNLGIYTNIPFVLILILSVYGLGQELGNRNAGLLAAILTPILPVFLTLQERATIDYMSISLFILSFYLTFKTEGFTNKKYSILLGVLLLLELLTKWPFIIPSIPLLIYAFVNLGQQKKNRKKILLNWTIVAFICIPGVVWYLFNWTIIWKGLLFFWDPTGYAQLIWANPHGFTFNNLILYFYTFPSQASGVGIAVLFFFIVAFFIKTRNTKTAYLYASILVTYVVLTILDDKSPFYIAYVYPLLMLTTLDSMSNIKKYFIHFFAIATFSSAIIFNFLISRNSIERFKEMPLNTPDLKTMLFPEYTSKFTSEKWPTLSFFDGEISKKNCPNGVLVFTDNRFLNFPNVDYFLAINLIDIKRDPAYRYYNPATADTFNLGYIDLYDCIITKNGDPGIFASSSIMKEVDNYLTKKNTFILKTFSAPDNSKINIYSRKQNG